MIIINLTVLSAALNKLAIAKMGEFIVICIGFFAITLWEVLKFGYRRVFPNGKEILDQRESHLFRKIPLGENYTIRTNKEGNFVYLLSCNGCGVYYIGETGNLRNRLNSHSSSWDRKADNDYAAHRCLATLNVRFEMATNITLLVKIEGINEVDELEMRRERKVVETLEIYRHFILTRRHSLNRCTSGPRRIVVG